MKELEYRVAIEALENHVAQTRPIYETSKAIDYLKKAHKEALAQPEQEPVAWVVESEEYNAEGERPILREIDYYSHVVDKLPAGTKLYTHPPVPTAQPHDCTRSHPHEEMSKECELRTEIARLTNCLKRANAQAEHLEREWYLRGNEIERLTAQPKEPEQEPYCWTWDEFVSGGKWRAEYGWEKPTGKVTNLQPLYTKEQL